MEDADKVSGLKQRLDLALERCREMACPAPMRIYPDDHTTGGCYDHGQCGCVHRGIMDAILGVENWPQPGSG